MLVLRVQTAPGRQRPRGTALLLPDKRKRGRPQHRDHGRHGQGHLRQALRGQGYISKALAELLFQDGVQLMTKVRKNMKEQNLSDVDAILLRKRALVESVNDELKNICKVEHTRHRSVKGFLVNLVTGLAAYCFFPKNRP